MADQAIKSGKKILLVDDSAIIRDAVTLLLEEHGFVVVPIGNVFAFSPTFNREKPDLVLVDVTMPALRGDQLVEVARRHRLHDCPLVLFSDRPADELRALAKTCGASGFIRKTNDEKALLAAIDGFLKGYAASKSPRPPGKS